MISIPKKYERNIKRSYINPGVTLLIENFTKDFIFNFEVNISIHRKPELVPETLYKFIKICNSFEIFEIKDIKEVEEIADQSIEIRFPKKIKGVYVDYDTLLKEESFFIYKILKKADSLIGLVLTNILLDSAYMDSVFRTSKIILEKVYKPKTSIDEMIYAVMVGITGGFAGNFNRVILFREDEEFFKVQRAIGPADEVEAHRIYESFETLESNIIPYLNNYKIGKMFFSNLEEKIKDIKIIKEKFMKNKLLKSAISFNKTIKLPTSQLRSIYSRLF
ncbi:hypothetical protein [Petrotoga sp. 9PWA.NaAc.5.4]|uniref:hypothetical protein n=1 Tax=Petrotoga sp. 9PWA.NaAc.5.4 TaxID=1434328 RepID=UPI0011B5F6A5|nr:hypothetical protein [Petrotoga sp. 9PWA.NaAc.5.4]